MLCIFWHQLWRNWNTMGQAMILTEDMHVTRSWYEDPPWMRCACPREVCGCTQVNKWLLKCPDHNMSHTFCAHHLAENCTGAP